ncbi:MAG TPA: PucR family transcriptional regulator [Acidimicrobiales bacterium]|nr:PucR family transcriptional regulator [Acidimicrobiales bacterium]
MPITVGQLIEIEHLGLSVEAGASGLNREIIWAHVCELGDPRPWLEGGELIMTTGLAVPRPASAQIAYVDRLCEAGAAALGVAEGMSAPPLTSAMRRHADGAELPVLRVSYEVPFIAISQVVLAANHRSLEQRMLRSLSIFDSLRRGTSVLGSTAEVLDRLEVVSGYDLGITSDDRTLVVGERALVSMLPELPHGAVERPIVEMRVVDQRRRYVLPLSIAGRFAGLLLAQEKEPGSGLGALALQNVATVAAVQLAATRKSRDVYFRIAREAFDDVFSGTVDAAALSRRVQLAGVSTGAVMVLLAIDGLAEPLERDVYGSLCDRGVLTLLRRDGRTVWLAIEHSDFEKLLASKAFDEVLPGGCRAGVSRPFDALADVRLAASEAQWALAEAHRSQRPLVQTGDAFDPESEFAWLPRDRFVLGQLVDRILGPLASDRLGGDLMGTLQAYLEEGKRIDTTCRRLGVHRHTLAYRLRRVEELTGRSLHQADDVVELWRALRARAVLAPLNPPVVPDAPSAPASRRSRPSTT